MPFGVRGFEATLLHSPFILVCHANVCFILSDHYLFAHPYFFVYFLWHNVFTCLLFIWFHIWEIPALWLLLLVIHVGSRRRPGVMNTFVRFVSTHPTRLVSKHSKTVEMVHMLSCKWYEFAMSWWLFWLDVVLYEQPGIWIRCNMYCVLNECIHDEWMGPVCARILTLSTISL